MLQLPEDYGQNSEGKSGVVNSVYIYLLLDSEINYLFWGTYRNTASFTDM